jgi:hypothetical protein
MAYESPGQFLELLGVLKSLGDQVHGIRMADPAHVQMQDLVDRPFRAQRARKGGDFDANPRSVAWEQLRILDLNACIAAVSLPGETVRFTLELTDPVAAHVPADAAWRGVAGRYTVTLGPASSIEEGGDDTLPVLTASVGAFTRLWIGARPAASLLITDDFTCAPELAAALDAVVRLPAPVGDWDA